MADDAQRATRPAKSGSRSGAGRQDGRSLPRRVQRFLREVVAEMRKVIWPTRQQELTYTIVVLVFVSVVVAFVASLDLGFQKLMFLVFGDG